MTKMVSTLGQKGMKSDETSDRDETTFMSMQET
jgi:hypothetical protein